MPWGAKEAETGKYEWGWGLGRSVLVSCHGISVLQTIQLGAIAPPLPLIR